MRSWSIHIKRNDETLLFAESTDPNLDKIIRENSLEILSVNSGREVGYGYPNRYRILNGRLPNVGVYRYTNYTKQDDRSYRVKREDLLLGPFSNLELTEVLWVELWDLS